MWKQQELCHTIMEFLEGVHYRHARHLGVDIPERPHAHVLLAMQELLYLIVLQVIWKGAHNVLLVTIPLVVMV